MAAPHLQSVEMSADEDTHGWDWDTLSTTTSSSFSYQGDLAYYMLEAEAGQDREKQLSELATAVARMTELRLDCQRCRLDGAGLAIPVSKLGAEDPQLGPVVVTLQDHRGERGERQILLTLALSMGTFQQALPAQQLLPAAVARQARLLCPNLTVERFVPFQSTPATPAVGPPTSSHSRYWTAGGEQRELERLRRRLALREDFVSAPARPDTVATLQMEVERLREKNTDLLSQMRHATSQRNEDKTTHHIKEVLN